MEQRYWPVSDDASPDRNQTYVMVPISPPGRSNDSLLNRTASNGSAHSGSGLADDGEAIALNEIIFVLDSYVTPFICAVGCIGNILNLTVLSRSRFRQTDGRSESGAHVGLIFMAVSDLLLCVAMFPRALLPSIHLLFEEYDFQLLYQAYGTGVITTFILISTWITVDMTILRYFYICHPLLSRKWNCRKCALVVYPVSSVACCLLNVPSFFQYQITDFSDKDGAFYMIDIGLLEPKAMKEFRYCQVIVGVIVPAVMLIYCNIRLVQALRRSHRIRIRCYVQDHNSQRSRKWITVTLIVISLGFIVLVFPCELMDFFVDYIKMNISRTESFLLVRSLANTMQVTNFALNFIVYCIINVHFRMILQEMCRCSTTKQGPSLMPPSSIVSAGSIYSSRRLRLSQSAV
ncbi:hypothetical protein LSH36_428g02007 [Paralvinella palmiformis]|uniref:G-protein coupled receptors family 1 profile domain-containing protein n=1 Tax=Paralvinella palmiformis TaxID=53620 RepID=A0AAD9MY05_9ANNE|nr:hypothetical protein LSH36_428g02007 [Paralvinella palmiformis]